MPAMPLSSRATLLLAACLAMASLLVPPPAAAWGKLGHRLAAALAEQELSPAARREVARLLAGEPEPTLAGISTWADDLRANDPGLGRRSAPWHYINLLERGCSYDATRDCEGSDCVVGAILAQSRILADRGHSDAERLQALRFVVHFIADVHQPLHAGAAHDKGGNTVQVRMPAPFIPPWAEGNPGSNLHSVWDNGLLYSSGHGEAAYLAHLLALPLAVPTVDAPLAPDAGAWASESCAVVAREGFYPPRPALDTAYYAHWRPVADERLRAAGSRLAAVLNAALGD
jgi:nuclease S1